MGWISCLCPIGPSAFSGPASSIYRCQADQARFGNFPLKGKFLLVVTRSRSVHVYVRAEESHSMMLLSKRRFILRVKGLLAYPQNHVAFAMLTRSSCKSPSILGSR
jgi:hypothetical protein